MTSQRTNSARRCATASAWFESQHRPAGSRNTLPPDRETRGGASAAISSSMVRAVLTSSDRQETAFRNSMSGRGARASEACKEESRWSLFAVVNLSFGTESVLSAG